ncbi:MAG: hypothetical protein PHO15_02415 [Eubacteriales bacterium]|nr:hypothetical protein [Eubacteriales bacterium]
MTDAAYLAFDTSCYTTSVAVVADGKAVSDKRMMLSVPKGQRGLRQSEAVFAHVKNLGLLFSDFDTRGYHIKAAAYSEKPCPKPDSYMPVFGVGESFALACAAALGVKAYPLTHQHGHIYAAFFGGLPDDGPYICFHVSGGTLDILRIGIRNGAVADILPIGGGLDITCGQLIDRVGVAAGLAFPSGHEIERVYIKNGAKLAVHVKALGANLSGAETQAMTMLRDGHNAAYVVSGVIDCVAATLVELIKNAAEKTGIKNFIFTGGVICNKIIRREIEKTCDGAYDCVIAQKEYCRDNACGLALAAEILHRKGE